MRSLAERWGQRQEPPPCAGQGLWVQQPKLKTAKARVLLKQHNQAQATGLSLPNAAGVPALVTGTTHFQVLEMQGAS